MALEKNMRRPQFGFLTMISILLLGLTAISAPAWAEGDESDSGNEAAERKTKKSNAKRTSRKDKRAKKSRIKKTKDKTKSSSTDEGRAKKKAERDKSRAERKSKKATRKPSPEPSSEEETKSQADTAKPAKKNALKSVGDWAEKRRQRAQERRKARQAKAAERKKNAEKKEGASKSKPKRRTGKQTNRRKKRRSAKGAGETNSKKAAGTKKNTAKDASERRRSRRAERRKRARDARALRKSKKASSTNKSSTSRRTNRKARRLERQKRRKARRAGRSSKKSKRKTHKNTGRRPAVKDCSSRMLKRLAVQYLRKGTIAKNRYFPEGSITEMTLNEAYKAEFEGTKILFVKAFSLGNERVYAAAESMGSQADARVRACEYGLGRPGAAKKGRSKVYRLNSGAHLQVGSKNQAALEPLSSSPMLKLKSRMIIFVVDAPSEGAALRIEAISESDVERRAKIDKEARLKANRELMRQRKAAIAARLALEAAAKEKEKQQLAISREVIEMAEYLDRKYYDDFAWHGTGAAVSLRVTASDGRTTLLGADQWARKDRTTYCTSFVLQVVANVLEKRGRFKAMSKLDAKQIQKIFFGNVAGVRSLMLGGTLFTEKELLEGQSQIALTQFGLGKAVTIADARSGDIVYLNHGDGFGHQFLFDTWIQNTKGKRIGFISYGAHGIGVKRKPYCFVTHPDSQTEDWKRVCEHREQLTPSHLVMTRLTP